MINGIYAATLSVLDKNLALNIEKTIKYAENLIDQGCHVVTVCWQRLYLPTAPYGLNRRNNIGDCGLGHAVWLPAGDKVFANKRFPHGHLGRQK